MKLKLIIVVIIFIFCEALPASNGKLFLNNGKSLEGDIMNLDDGGYWLTIKNGSVKFEKSEVSSVIFYPERNSDRVNRAYMADSSPFESFIRREAAKNGLDPALIRAVIKAESNFNPFDTSVKGACGLMQLMPDTARIFNIKDIYSPDENIRAGTCFLKDMLVCFDGDIVKALAAYNAGPEVVKKYNDVPPYKETKNFVNNVLFHYRNGLNKQ